MKRVSRREWTLGATKLLVEGEFIVTNRGVDEFHVRITDIDGVEEVPNGGEGEKVETEKSPAEKVEPILDPRKTLAEVQKTAEELTGISRDKIYTKGKDAANSKVTDTSRKKKVGDMKPVDTSGQFTRPEETYSKHGCGCKKMEGVTLCMNHGRL